MSTIKVEQAHSLSIDEAKSKVDAFGQDMKERFGLSMSWDGNTARLKGLGASGDVEVRSDMVVVAIKLGMMAKAAGIKADRVEASVTKRLQSALG
ncbi:MAG: polyhydroxyalkanoic acid system family protein [Myxococcota bacterium]